MFCGCTACSSLLTGSMINHSLVAVKHCGWAISKQSSRPLAECFSAILQRVTMRLPRGRR